MLFCRFFSSRSFWRTDPSPSSIPYFPDPSASPTSPHASQYMSTKVEVPSGRTNSRWSCGIGRPARLMVTLLTDSRTDWAPGSANATTARALATPTLPAAASSSNARSPGLHSLRRNASSAAHTAPVKGLDRATSTIVRAGVVTGIPSTSVTTSARSRLWQIELFLRLLPLPGRCLVVVTRRVSIPWTGRPCNTRADVWDIAVPGLMLPAAARERISRIASAWSGPVGTSDASA